jgi:hypothetical protein
MSLVESSPTMGGYTMWTGLIKPLASCTSLRFLRLGLGFFDEIESLRKILNLFAPSQLSSCALISLFEGETSSWPRWSTTFSSFPACLLSWSTRACLAFGSLQGSGTWWWWSTYAHTGGHRYTTRCRPRLRLYSSIALPVRRLFLLLPLSMPFKN